MLGGNNTDSSAEQAKPTLPPLRTWAVRNTDTENGDAGIELVRAHSVEYNEAGLAFLTAALLPNGKVATLLTRGFATGIWLAFKEVSSAVVTAQQPSISLN